jgi:hypothetical protein
MSLPLGAVSMVTLATNPSSTTSSTWYIPMSNYVGSVYVSQIDAGGNLVGSCAWTNISANTFTPQYISSNFSDGMAVGYNSAGAYLGLQFTGVQLANYSLCVMYVGTVDGGGSLAFQNKNPLTTNYYTISGAAPTRISDNSTYTSLEFYADATITFSTTVTLLDTSTTNTTGHVSYTLTGTSNPTSTTKTSAGADCSSLTSDSGLQISSASSTTITIGYPSTSTTTLTTTILVDGLAIADFDTSFSGGVGYNGKGGGGGSAGPGGPGTAGSSTLGGGANTGYNNVGKPGQDLVGTTSGAGGGGATSLQGYGAYGAAVLTLSGVYCIYQPGV